MTQHHRYRVAWTLALIGGICLGAAGYGLSQSPPSRKLPPPAKTPEDLSIAFRDVAQRVLPSVVSITSESRPHEVTQDIQNRGNASPQDMEMFRRFFGDDPRFEQFFGDQGEQPRRMTPGRRGTGSGFIVDEDGIILTNSHVVEGADRVLVKLNDGREILADNWNYDPRSDVAIIRVKVDGKLPALPLGDSKDMQVGDWVLALGNPFNVGTTVTSGIISATGRGPGINEREEYLQTDAAINPGNSGGPLVNLFGQVVGINTAISTRSGGYDGIGFAIPSNNVRWVANQLIENGEVRRAYLGVALKEFSNELRKQFHVGLHEGALVSQVFDETPAAAAGVEPMDVIMEFNGQKITDRDNLIDVVERSEPDKSYDLVVLRNGEKKTLTVDLKPMPGDYTAALRRARSQDHEEQAQPEEESTEVSKLGIQASSLNDSLRQQLGLDDGTQGVVIRDVKAGSPADEAGLQAGDVIERVGTNVVKDLDAFRAVVEDVNIEDGVVLYVHRGDSADIVLLKKDQ